MAKNRPCPFCGGNHRKLSTARKCMERIKGRKPFFNKKGERA